MKSTKAKFLSLFLVIFVLAVSLSACGSSDTDAASDAAAPDTSAAASDTSAAAPAASGDVVPAFKFTNTGSLDICQLFLSPTDKNEWGPNQLPDGQKIAAGSAFTLTNIPAGTYDAKAVGCDGTTEATIQLDIKN